MIFLQALQLRPLSPADVGLVPILLLICITATILALVAAFIYLVLTRASVAPEYRGPLALAPVLIAAAAVGYVLLALRYSELLQILQMPRQFGFGTTVQASIPVVSDLMTLRYGLWVVAIPLATMMFPLLLHLRGQDARRALTALPLLGLWMMASWAVGEQQIGLDGRIDTGMRLIWGFIGLVGYAGIIVFVFGFLRGSAIISEPEERRAFRHLSLLLVTTWLVYPASFMLPVAFPETRLMWMQLVLNAGDLVNFISPGVIMLLAARRMTYKKVGAAPYA